MKTETLYHAALPRLLLLQLRVRVCKLRTRMRMREMGFIPRYEAELVRESRLEAPVAARDNYTLQRL